MIIYPNQSITLSLPAGEVLTLANPSGSIGSACRLARIPGSGDSQSTTAIAGANLTFGPYADVERFLISCTAGSVTPSMTAPDPSLVSMDDEAAALLAAGLALKVSHSLATAQNDFLVGAPTPFGSWVKKTLAEVKTILGLGGTIDASTAESDFLTGNATTGNWQKKTLAQVLTILGMGTKADKVAVSPVPTGKAAVFDATGNLVVVTPATFGAACTEIESAVALLNQVRAALIAAGIGTTPA